MVYPGGWRETDSYSDGMFGWVEFTNAETTETVKYYWSVTSKEYRSQEQARDAFRAHLAEPPYFATPTERDPDEWRDTVEDR